MKLKMHPLLGGHVCHWLDSDIAEFAGQGVTDLTAYFDVSRQVLSTHKGGRIRTRSEAPSLPKQHGSLRLWVALQKAER